MDFAEPRRSNIGFQGRPFAKPEWRARGVGCTVRVMRDLNKGINRDFAGRANGLGRHHRARLRVLLEFLASKANGL